MCEGVIFEVKGVTLFPHLFILTISSSPNFSSSQRFTSKLKTTYAIASLHRVIKNLSRKPCLVINFSPSVPEFYPLSRVHTLEIFLDRLVWLLGKMKVILISCSIVILVKWQNI